MNWSNIFGTLPLPISGTVSASEKTVCQHCRSCKQNTYTIEPRYLELAYLELPAISNLNQFPMDLPILFIVFLLAYLELAYLELPAIWNKF